ncbi:MAG TPA: type IV toxin-antitoxin system AbiEi family antitoxin domain-containing protein [Acidimicrobiales bacterium]|nr:type IV toxin-antitoxin system AbiEi family antitoxin domain-containing protein [Acidimicrobiales bacterium]
MSTAESQLRRLAARQHGLVSRSQVRALGLTARQVDRRTADGVLVAVRRGIYRVAGSPSSPEQALLAACMAAGSGAVASHRSAAALWELRGVDWPRPELTVPIDRRPGVPGVTVHRSVMLGRPDVTRHRRIPVTTPARTLLDLGAVAPELVEPAMEDALFRSLVSLSSLRRTLDRVGAHGRGGTAVLRDLVDQRARGTAPTESPLEDALVALLRKHRLPEPVRQHPVTVGGGRWLRLDLAYPAARLGIEADGRRWHSGRADFQADRERGNLLVARGWTVLRFGWDDVGRRGDRVADDVRRLLQQRRAS